MTQLRNTIAEVKQSNEKTDPKKKWEWLKFKMAEQARRYEKEEYRQERNHELLLNKRLQVVSRQLDEFSDPHLNMNGDHDRSSTPEEDVLQERESLAREIKELELSRANRTIMRSSANWALNGEKPTKFFLNLQKIQSKSNPISELEDMDGNLTTDPKKNLEIEK